MQIRFRPLTKWRGELTKQREHPRFTSTWTQTLTVLERELEQLGATEVVIEVAGSESDIRIDGWPKATMRPEHPGVIISFDSKYGPLRYMTDRFETGENYVSAVRGRAQQSGMRRIEGWQANVRAIALGLEALRQVDRYGITRRGEQYTGWKALPAGSDGQRPMTVDEAALLLAGFLPGCSATELIANKDRLIDAYRAGAKVAHPDAGGSQDQWLQVQKAFETVRQHG